MTESSILPYMSEARINSFLEKRIAFLVLTIKFSVAKFQGNHLNMDKKLSDQTVIG